MYIDTLNSGPFRAGCSLAASGALFLCIAFIGACQIPQSPEQPQAVKDDHTSASFQLETRWSKARQGLDVKDLKGTAETASLSYRLQPDCSLVYDIDHHSEYFRTVDDVRSSPRREQVLGRMELTSATSSTSRWTLRHHTLGFYHLHRGQRRASQQYWPGQLPNVLLLATPNKIIAAHEYSPLWHGMKSFSGFSLFWPELPSSENLSPRAELLTWLDIDAHLAALIEVRGTLDDPSNKGKGSFVARYVVLSTGRVLHAALVQNISQAPFATSTDAADASSLDHWRIIAEARLTGACDGPTLSTFEFESSRAAALLDTYMRLIQDLIHDPDGPAPLLGDRLATDLIDTHQSGHLKNLFSSHITRYGIDVMGNPSRVISQTDEGDIFQIRLTGRARNIDGSSGPVTVLTYVTAEVEDDDVRILSIRSTTDQHEEPRQRRWNILEVSPARLYSPALPP